jgi:hypothetical protein
MITEEKDVVLGGWLVKLVRGSKGQLSLYVSHQDGTEIQYLATSGIEPLKIADAGNE